MNRNNANFKRICLALELSKHDVSEIMAETVSKSQIDGWLRSEESTKRGTGNSAAQELSRFRPMSDADFDRFCEGLIEFLKNNN